MKISSVTLDVFPLSFEEMQMVKNKYPAFTARQLADNLVVQGVSTFAPSRTIQMSEVEIRRTKKKQYSVIGINDDGTAAIATLDDATNSTWFAFNYVYDEELPFIKNAKLVVKTANVTMPKQKTYKAYPADAFNIPEDNRQTEEVESIGYVSTFNKKQYLLVNYEDAKAAYEKNGEHIPVLCVQIDGFAKSVPFSTKGSHYFGESTEMHKQYHKLAFNGASTEELKGVIPTEFTPMVEGDVVQYNTATPKIEESKWAKQKNSGKKKQTEINVEDITEKPTAKESAEQKNTTITNAKKDIEKWFDQLFKCEINEDTFKFNVTQLLVDLRELSYITDSDWKVIKAYYDDQKKKFDRKVKAEAAEIKRANTADDRVITKLTNRKAKEEKKDKKPEAKPATKKPKTKKTKQGKAYDDLRKDVNEFKVEV